MKSIEVVASVIVKDNKILCCKRGPGRDLEGYYEFPGGKIEVNETKEEALIREIKEELNIDIIINKYLTTINHEYNTFNLTMHVYICSLINENPILIVHTESMWCNKDKLKELDFAEADYKFLDMIKSV